MYRSRRARRSPTPIRHCSLLARYRDCRLHSCLALSNRHTLVSADTRSLQDFLQVPFLENVVTETHFRERNRMGRVVSFMARMAQDILSRSVRLARTPAPLALALTDGARLVNSHEASHVTLMLPCCCTRTAPRAPSLGPPTTPATFSNSRNRQPNANRAQASRSRASRSCDCAAISRTPSTSQRGSHRMAPAPSRTRSPPRTVASRRAATTGRSTSESASHCSCVYKAPPLVMGSPLRHPQHYSSVYSIVWRLAAAILCRFIAIAIESDESKSEKSTATVKPRKAASSAFSLFPLSTVVACSPPSSLLLPLVPASLTLSLSFSFSR